jgi:hypothetical protein
VGPRYATENLLFAEYTLHRKSWDGRILNKSTLAPVYTRATPPDELFRRLAEVGREFTAEMKTTAKQKGLRCGHFIGYFPDTTIRLEAR